MNGSVKALPETGVTTNDPEDGGEFIFTTTDDVLVITLESTIILDIRLNVKEDPTGSEFSLIVRYAKVDSVDACVLVSGAIVYSSDVRAITERSMLLSSTSQTAVPPILAGTFTVPSNCNFLPAFIIPEAAKLGADNVTTGEREGTILIVTLLCADRVRLTS